MNGIPRATPSTPGSNSCLYCGNHIAVKRRLFKAIKNADGNPIYQHTKKYSYDKPMVDCDPNNVTTHVVRLAAMQKAVERTRVDLINYEDVSKAVRSLKEIAEGLK